jgi:hypothetical protein
MAYRKQNALTVDGVLYADANKVTSSTAAPTNGQLIIGSTAGVPAAASLTAGTGISITPGSNSITIAVSGSAVGETITGDTGGALSPSAGNWNIVANLTAGASVKFSGSGNTLSLNSSDANNNTFVGAASGNATLTSILSSGFGSHTLNALTNGNNNSCLGYSSLPSLTSGSNNCAFGNSAGALLVSGSNNLLMGIAAFGAGTQYTSSESSNIILTNVGVTGDSNIIRIGTQGSGTGQQNKCFIAGIASVSVSNLNIVTINTSTGQLGSQAAANVGTVTQFDVLVGGASGAIASVGPGSSGQVLQSAGNAANPAYSTATYPATATGTGTILRADGTNWVASTSTYPNTNAVSTLLYASSANVMSALATANSGVLTTSSSGVPSIDTTNFAVLSTGVQMKGNNTNTAPPAGFIGEQISSAATSVATTSSTPKTITSINLTAGIWDISAISTAVPTGGTGLIGAHILGISTTNNTLIGNIGDDQFQINVSAGVVSGCVPQKRATLSGNTTYYAVVNNVYSSTTCPTNARITATRVG